MALKKAHFENQISGSAATADNSDDFGDTRWDVLSATGGASILYSNQNVAHGAGSLKFQGMSAAATSFGVVGFGGYTATNFAARTYLTLSALPSANCLMFQVRAGSGSMGGMAVNEKGLVSVTSPLGATVAASAVGLVDPSTLYRFEMMYIIGTAGRQLAFVYPDDSLNPIFSYDSGTGVNTGSTVIDNCRVGKTQTNVTIGDFWVDDFSVQDTFSALGPYLPSPVASANVNTTNAVIDASGSAAGSGGNLTYSISPTAGTSQINPGIFLVPRSTTATYTVTVTESGTGKTDTVTAAVTSVGAVSRTRTLNAQGTWA